MTNFKDIPEEKFTAMGRSIENSLGKKIEWPLKVKAIDIQNIKNIDYINTTFSDWVVVGGKNAQGKTSFIDSIFLALKGTMLYWTGTEPTKIIKHWEDKAVISLILRGEEREIIINRTFKKGKNWGSSKLEAFFENGAKIWQDQLKDLINVLTIDPLKLDKMNLPDSIKEVQNITGLDTSEIDKKLADSEEERKYEKQALAKLIALVDESTKFWVPEKVESVNINDLLVTQKGFNELAKKQDILKDKIEDFKKAKLAVEYFELELQKSKEAMETTKTDGINFKETLKDETEKFILDNWTEEHNTESLNNTQETNEKAKAYIDYIKQVKEREDVKKGVDLCENEVLKLRNQKIKMIKASKMPNYMEISETYGILVDGIEYKQLNTARKIEVAIDLVLISWSPLRVLNIEEGGELDFNTLSKIQDKVLDAGFQIFIQRAKIDAFDTIIISEGELIEDEQEKQRLIEENKAEEKTILDKLNK